MAINFECEHCGHQGRAKDELAGERAKCPECKEWLLIPDGAEQVRRELSTPGRAETFVDEEVANAHLEVSRQISRSTAESAKSLQKISDNVGCLFYLAAIGLLVGLVAAFIVAGQLQGILEALEALAFGKAQD